MLMCVHVPISMGFFQSVCRKGFLVLTEDRAIISPIKKAIKASIIVSAVCSDSSLWRLFGPNVNRIVLARKTETDTTDGEVGLHERIRQEIKRRVSSVAVR